MSGLFEAVCSRWVVCNGLLSQHAVINEVLKLGKADLAEIAAYLRYPLAEVVAAVEAAQ